MPRNVMGLIMGLTVAFIIKWSILSINERIFPLPEGIDPRDMETMEAYVKDLPAMAYITSLISNILCTIGGSFVTAKIAQSHHQLLTIGMGTFLMLLGILNMVTIPHPHWYIPLDIITYIPCSFIGYYWSKR